MILELAGVQVEESWNIDPESLIQDHWIIVGKLEFARHRKTIIEKLDTDAVHQLDWIMFIY